MSIAAKTNIMVLSTNSGTLMAKLTLSTNRLLLSPRNVLTLDGRLSRDVSNYVTNNITNSITNYIRSYTWYFGTNRLKLSEGTSLLDYHFSPDEDENAVSRNVEIKLKVINTNFQAAIFKTNVSLVALSTLNIADGKGLFLNYVGEGKDTVLYYGVNEYSEKYEEEFLSSFKGEIFNLNGRLMKRIYGQKSSSISRFSEHKYYIEVTKRDVRDLSSGVYYFYARSFAKGVFDRRIFVLAK